MRGCAVHVNLREHGKRHIVRRRAKLLNLTVACQAPGGRTDCRGSRARRIPDPCICDTALRGRRMRSESALARHVDDQERFAAVSAERLRLAADALHADVVQETRVSWPVVLIYHDPSYHLASCEMLPGCFSRLASPCPGVRPPATRRRPHRPPSRRASTAPGSSRPIPNRGNGCRTAGPMTSSGSARSTRSTTDNVEQLGAGVVRRSRHPSRPGSDADRGRRRALRLHRLEQGEGL